MSSVLKQSITLKELQFIATKNKQKVMRKFNSKGYIENLGVNEARDVEEACMRLSHDGMANWSERQQAGNIAIDFQNWLDDL